VSKYIDRIIELGGSPADDYKVIDSGWSNVVVEVNQHQIFRFPRKLTPQFEVEKTFLAQFASNSPIKVPNPEPSPIDFITYRRIEGERFDPAKFWRLDEAYQEKVIMQLGEFLTALHSFKFEHQYLSEFPYGGENFWEDLWPLVASDLSERARINASRFFEDAFEQIGREEFVQTIVHADLGTNNLLVDFEALHLTGVIDFSDLCWGDPATDFAGFYRHFGRGFVRRLLDYYQRPIEDNFWTRIEFQANRKAFFVIYFAQNYGFQEHIPSIVGGIEKRFVL
jgi:aminoglycoside 2''-phosphotransferase